MSPDNIAVEVRNLSKCYAIHDKPIDRLKRAVIPRFLEELTKNGTTPLFVSHDMTMVKNFCRSAIYLHHGEMRASGDPALVAEQYFMDMREQQLGNVAPDSSRVIKNAARGRTEGIAFGTAEGDILQAVFADHGSSYANVLRRETVALKVSVRFRGTLSKPDLSVIVQDIHNITLGGNFFYISDFSTEDDWSIAEIDVSFPANALSSMNSDLHRAQIRSA